MFLWYYYYFFKLRTYYFIYFSFSKLDPALITALRYALRECR